MNFEQNGSCDQKNVITQILQSSIYNFISNLDAVLPKRRKRCSKEHLLKSICELATNLEGVERRYVKKGQRLLFCGPDLMALVPKCTEIRAAFDALHGE